MIHELPYTDMHELNLDWFLEKFKELMSNVEAQDNKISSIEDTVQQFTEFVTTYFDNLDVQQEINNKLNAMADDGSLQALLEPYFDEFVSDVSTALNNQGLRMDVLESRMDAFSTLTEGSTTGDAELMDIRVAFNGSTYPSAGDSVRGQADFLDNRIDNANVYKSVNPLQSEYQQGWWGVGAGAYDPDHTNAICSILDVDQSYKYLKCDSGFKLRLQAWNATTNVYEGTWNGSTFTTVNPNYYLTNIDFKSIITAFPAYKFKLVLFTSNGTDNVDLDDVSHIYYISSSMDDVYNEIEDIINTIEGSDLISFVSGDPSEWQQGWWGASTGLYDDAHNNAICCQYFLDTDIINIKCDSLKFRLQAWNSSDVYQGIWDGSAFALSLIYYKSLDIAKIRKTYPTYKFKITVFANNGLDGVAVSSASDVTYTYTNLEEPAYDYKYAGEKIDVSTQGYNIKSINYTLPDPADYGCSSRQDFDIYDGKMFQLMSDDYVAIVDMSDGSLVNAYSIKCGHGNACQFGKYKDDPSDPYPPLYCFDYTSNKVYKNKVTDSESTLLATYVLDGPGYRFSGGYDADNNIIVSINYASNSSTDGTGNHMIFTVWNLNDLTTVDTDTYKPGIIKNINIPFIPVVQGCTIFKNKLYVVSGFYPTFGFPVKIYVFDYDGICKGIVDDLPNAIITSEGEGITFYKDSDHYKCYFTTYDFYKIDFE